MSQPTTSSNTPSGVLTALGCYLCWGLLPIYWRAVHHVGSDEVLTHRIIWSFVFLLPLILKRGSARSLLKELRSASVLRYFLFSTILITFNWLAYIWAIHHGYTVQCSLGYFLLPFMNIAVGVIAFQERLFGVQKFALALAALGVLFAVILSGTVPWIGLFLATVFTIYGYLRKIGRFHAIDSLFIETALQAPFALLYLFMLEQRGVAGFLQISLSTDLLLMFAGIATAVPLLLYTHAARNLPMTTLGWLQYLNPTTQLIIALFIFHEPVTTPTWVAFLFIWSAIGILAFDAINRSKKRVRT